ncbi:MAG TPA: Crp/Fnr family transcriptional regulator [Pseudomonadales bacterium]
MKRRDLTAVLCRDEWFAALTPALQDAILQHGRVRRYRDRPIYLAGDPPNDLFALIWGQIHVTRISAAGRAALLMVANPGTWFGESSMIDGMRRFSTARAVGEAAVLQITPSTFRTIVQNDPSRFASFAQIVFRRYRRAIEHIVDFSSLPLPVRLAQRLLEVGTGGNGGRRVVKLSQQELADALGTSRQSVNKALKALERDGLIEIGYASVRLRVPAELRKLADTPIRLDW